MTRSLALRIVALLAVLAVGASVVTPAFAEVTARQPCAPGPDGCPRSSVLASCCCGQGSPAVPGAQLQPAGAVPSWALSRGPLGVAATPGLTAPALTPRHGHLSADLTTLLSTLLI